MADSGNNTKVTKITTTTTTAVNPGFRNERSDSTSSSGSAASTSSYSSSPTSPRRASQGGLFEGLTAQKRGTDPASIARRQSMNEQRPKSGFIGQMWNNWVHGPGPNK
ncbi:hypothetical protein V8F20_007666 [Naviculisporaceae sp. PSN 640]